MVAPRRHLNNAVELKDTTGFLDDIHAKPPIYAQEEASLITCGCRSVKTGLPAFYLPALSQCGVFQERETKRAGTFRLGLGLVMSPATVT